MNHDKEDELLLVALQLYEIEQAEGVPLDARYEAMSCLNIHLLAS